MISDICLNIYLFTLIKEIDASYTNKKSVCASERLFKGNISSQYTNSCFFLCFCSVHPILYRSTSLSYYLIIMFFFFRTSCMRQYCVVGDQLFQGGNRTLHSHNESVGRSTCCNGIRCSKTLTPVLTLLQIAPIRRQPATISFRRITHCCHFARIQNTTHTRRFSSVPIL